MFPLKLDSVVRMAGGTWWELLPSDPAVPSRAFLMSLSEFLDTQTGYTVSLRNKAEKLFPDKHMTADRILY